MPPAASGWPQPRPGRGFPALGIMSASCLTAKLMAVSLLTGYQALRAEGFLCDVTLKVEGSEFPAHRSLLACSSDYFRALFKSHTRNPGRA